MLKICINKLEIVYIGTGGVTEDKANCDSKHLAIFRCGRLPHNAEIFQVVKRSWYFL